MTSDNKWDGRGKGSYLGNLIFVKLITFVGPIPAYLLLFFVSLYYSWADKKSIHALKKFRLRIGLSKGNLFHLQRHFFAFGTSIIDRVTFSVKKRHPFSFSLINKECLSDCLKQGQGGILLSAHIGNWEVGGSSLFDYYGAPVNAVMLDNEYHHIKEVYKNSIEQRRFKTIVIKEDALSFIIEIKAALARNELVCIHGDRVLAGKTEVLPFFNHDAEFPSGPFKIAAITKAPLIPVFALKAGLFKYTFKAYDPIRIEPDKENGMEAAIQQAMTTYLAILEEEVKKHPYQWYNFYDIWLDSVQRQ